MSSARTGTRRPAAGPRRTTAKRPASSRRPGRRRRSGWRRHLTAAQLWPAALVVLVLALVVGVTWNAAGDEPALDTAVCTLPSSSVTLTSEQVGNAHVIARVGRDRGLPERAVVIALATAMQESSLRNLDHGDRDSLGLFQQRPSQGWGAPEQLQDPVYAAGRFYDRLVQVPGWETGDLSLTADAVQRSAYPLAYGRWSDMAEELSAVTSAGGDTCAQ